MLRLFTLTVLLCTFTLTGLPTATSAVATPEASTTDDTPFPANAADAAKNKSEKRTIRRPRRQTSEVIVHLPKPQLQAGVPLMEALAKRHTTRELSNTALSDQHLSNLLWAAWGINRKDGKRTIPTANNRQLMALYLLLESGIWEYIPADHSIRSLSPDDMRDLAGPGAVTILYAAPESTASPMHIGSSYQNVALYAASAGLGNVIRATPVRNMAELISLPEAYRLYITQSIGIPASVESGNATNAAGNSAVVRQNSGL